MAMFRALYYFFSSYTDPAERRVGKFFKRVSEKDAPRKTGKVLLRLLQQDIATINLWTEHRYKGYDYLTKRTRKQLYANVAAIQRDFVSFAAAQSIDTEEVLEHIATKGGDVARLRVHSERLAYIATIMRYLSPKNGRYIYRASSSFGRLLRDPTEEVLEGDCNQIVTLYIALYAMRYDVTDVKLTLYPGHVALHFHGIDIETTNATFTKYDREGQTTAPIHEIVSVNLLDTSDTNFAKNSIHPEVFLQAARLAYVVSSHRQLVKKNLEVAYHNTVRHMLKEQRYKEALEYASQSQDHELIEVSAHNGALSAMKQHDFSGARRFAAHMQQKNAFLQTIDRNEAAQLYTTKHYESAAKIYARLGDKEMAMNCYKGMYVREQSRLGTIKTTADIKANAGTIRTMERYARQSGDQQLIKHAAQLAKHL